MKCFRCCCSVFLCSVLLLGVFSLPVKAAEPEVAYKLVHNSYIQVGDSQYNFPAFAFTPNNNLVEKAEPFYYGGVPGWIHPNKKYFIHHDFTIYDVGGSTICDGGRKVTVTFTNAYYSMLFQALDELENTVKYVYFNNPTSVKAYVVYTDGVWETHELNVEYNPSYRWLSANFSFDAQKSVDRILFQLDVDITSFFNECISLGIQGYKLTNYMGEHNGDTSIKVTVERSSEEAGLLSGILGWVKNTYNSVTDGFANLGNKLSSVITSITELPAKIWQFIENGLKGLFVPDEEYLAGYKDRWSELLSDRLGAVYQVVEVTFGAWDEVGESDKTDSISMPEVTIPLPDDNEFSFGGYDVKIVPEGFDFLATAVKSIVGVVCTLAFINGIRKRYDEIMGVNQ